MEHREIAVTGEAVAELRDLLEVNRFAGVEKFIKPFRAFCEKHDWEWFGLEPKRVFNFYAVQLASGYSGSRALGYRLKQLRNERYSVWIYHADPSCPDTHHRFDGLVLPPDHDFWTYYTPPLGWRCGCSISPADRPSQIARLRGDPAKQLPVGWDTVDPAAELHSGIEEAWGTQDGPDLLLLLAAIVDGHSPKPDFGD